MTQQEIYTALDQLVTANLGKPVEREDASNLDQCYDWFFAYCDALKIPRDAVRHLYAYEIWTKATDQTRQYFDLIPNTPTGVPQKADVPIFDTTVGTAGHVCVADGNVSGTTTFQSTDQNWNGHKYVEYIWHNYNGCLGWLRPKVSSTGTTVPMATISQADLDAIRKARDDNYNSWQASLTKITILQAKIDKAKSDLG